MGPCPRAVGGGDVPGVGRQCAKRVLARTTYTVVPPRMLIRALRRHKCRPMVTTRATSGSKGPSLGQGEVAETVDEQDHHDAGGHAVLR